LALVSWTGLSLCFRLFPIGILAMLIQEKLTENRDVQCFSLHSSVFAFFLFFFAPSKEEEGMATVNAWLVFVCYECTQNLVPPHSLRRSSLVNFTQFAIFIVCQAVPCARLDPQSIMRQRYRLAHARSQNRSVFLNVASTQKSDEIVFSQHAASTTQKPEVLFKKL
jgi:hypothetical protein